MNRVFAMVSLIALGAAACSSDSTNATEGGGGSTASGGSSATAGGGSAATGGSSSGSGGSQPEGTGEVDVTVLNEGADAATDAPITFGQVFLRGDVPAGSTVSASVNGASVPAQLDAKATYPDGSLRHGVVTLRMPSVAAGAAADVKLTSSSNATAGAAIALPELLASSFDAVASVHVGGKTYTASAKALLEKAQAAASCKPYGKDCNEWLAGPELSSWVVSAPLVDGDGAEHPLLSAIFEVRAYGPAPVKRVWVDVAIENSWAYTQAANVTYDAKLTVGGDEVFSTTGLTHYQHARWHKTYWWGGDPKLYAKLDSQYLQQTKAVPRYQADIHPSETLLNKARQSVEPMQPGDNTPHMGNTGAQPTIGPLPKWTSAYVVSTDPRAYRWMLANDDGLGSYSVHWRDKNTGMPISIEDYPCMTTLAAAFIAKCKVAPFADDRPPLCATGECPTPLAEDSAHHPSAGYVAYLVTGSWYALEEMEHYADWLLFKQNPGYRGYADGLISSNQIRGQAWSLRTLGYAAWILPDAAPMKPYFEKVVKNNIANYRELYSDNPDANNLGLRLEGNSSGYPSKDGTEQYVGIAPWQADFFTWSVANLTDLGFDDADVLLDYFAKFQVGMMTDPGYCWVLGATYQLQVKDTREGPIYPDFAKVYQVNFPELQGIECGSQAMADKLSEGGAYEYKPGEMTGYPYSPTGFPANLQIGMVGARRSKLPKAAEAWDKFANRTTSIDYSDEPQFGLWPRDVPASSRSKTVPKTSTSRSADGLSWLS